MRRLALPLLVGVAATALAGCSGEPEPVQTATPAPTTAAPSPTATPTSDADAGAVADVFDRYVAAVVTMENGPDADPTHLFGITGEQVTIDEVQVVSDYVAQGIRRVGAPQVGEPTISVDGDVAQLEVCIDEDTWTAESTAGLAVEETIEGPQPRVFGFERTDGAWLLTELADPAGASITC